MELEQQITTTGVFSRSAVRVQVPPPTPSLTLWVPKMSSGSSDQDFFTVRCADDDVGNREQ